MDDQKRFLCYECVGDNYLKKEIKQLGSVQECSFCGRRHISIDFDDLLIKVDKSYREYYGPGDEVPFVYGDDHLDYITVGDNPTDIIEEMLHVARDIAEEIVSCLSAREQWDVVRGGDFPFYDDTSVYKETKISSFEYSWTWKEICQEIKHTHRFINKNAVELLDNIFQGINEYKSNDDKPAIRTIPDGNEDRYIYRGRHADDDEAIKKICLSQKKQLGPPPVELATAGRMNPTGIPVFYGAFERETCIAELRIPVGSAGISAQFELIRPILVLDLTVFDEMPKPSMFDPDYRRKASHRIFLKSCMSKFENQFSAIPRHSNICQPNLLQSI